MHRACASLRNMESASDQCRWDDNDNDNRNERAVVEAIGVRLLSQRSPPHADPSAAVGSKGFLFLDGRILSAR